MSLARNNLSAASAARIVISQDTFDEAVKDNIETFGMDREEAIKDAIEQFQNAGADLSAVLLDGSDPNDHPVIASLNAINSWLEKGGEFSLSNIPDWEPWKEAFRDFIRNVGKSGDDGTSNRHVALSKNAVSVLWKCTELLCGLAKLEALTEEQTINPCPFQKSLVPVLRLSFEAMRALCTNFDEARAQLPAYYINYVHQVLQTAGTFRPFTRFSYPAEDDSFSTFLYALQKSSIQLATTLCVRREGNKTALFDAGAMNVLTSVLLGIVSEELQDIPCTKESIENHIANFVGVISDLFVRMLTDDDMDVHASRAYDMAREIAVDPLPGGQGRTLTEIFLDLAKRYEQNSAILSHIYATLRILVVNEDICKLIDKLAGVENLSEGIARYVETPLLPPAPRSAAADGSTSEDKPKVSKKRARLEAIPEEDLVEQRVEVDGATATSESSTDPTEYSAPTTLALVKTGLSLLRSLANSDENKAKMGKGNTMQVIIKVLQNCSLHAPILDQCLGLLANILLRQQGNAEIAFQTGAVPLIGAAMRAHPTHTMLQRSGCLAIRNLVVKSPERRDFALEYGFELILQKAYAAHPIARDVAYAAMRDLGLEYAETITGREQAERANRAIAANNIHVK